MNINVGGDTMRVDFDRTHSPVIQNLGPSYLWVARKGVPSEDGVRLEPGGTLAFGGPMLDSGPAYVLVQATVRDEEDPEDPVEAQMRVDPTPGHIVEAWIVVLAYAARLGLVDDIDAVWEAVADDPTLADKIRGNDAAWAIVVGSEELSVRLLAGGVGEDPFAYETFADVIGSWPIMTGWFQDDELLPRLFHDSETPDLSNVAVGFESGDLVFVRTAEAAATHAMETAAFDLEPYDYVELAGRCDTLGETPSRFQLEVQAPDGQGGFDTVLALDGGDDEVVFAAAEVGDVDDLQPLKIEVESEAEGGDDPYTAALKPPIAVSATAEFWKAVEGVVNDPPGTANGALVDSEAVGQVWESMYALNGFFGRRIGGPFWNEYPAAGKWGAPVDVAVDEGVVKVTRLGEYDTALVLAVGAPVNFDGVHKLKVDARCDTLGETSSRFTFKVVVDGHTIIDLDGSDDTLSERIGDVDAVEGWHRIEVHVDATEHGGDDAYEIEFGPLTIVEADPTE